MGLSWRRVRMETSAEAFADASFVCASRFKDSRRHCRRRQLFGALVEVVASKARYLVINSLALV